MARDFKAPSSIVNCIELVLAVIVGGLIGEIQFPFDNISRHQVIYGTAYGYLIISIIVVASIFLKEEIPKYVRLLIAGSAFVMYATSGGLLINSAVNNKDNDYLISILVGSDWYERTLSAGVISIALGLLYIVDAFFAFKS